MEDIEDRFLPAERFIDHRELLVWKKLNRSIKFALASSGHCLPNPVVTDSGVAIATTFSPGEVVARDARTGKQIWRSVLNRLCGFEPVLAGDKVIVTIDCAIIVFETTTGVVPWYLMPLPDGVWIRTVPLIHEGWILFADSNSYVHCVSVETGLTRWRRCTSRAKRRGINGQLTLINGVLIVGCNAGTVCGLDFETGEILWRTRTWGPTWNYAQAIGDSAYLQSNGRLVAVSRSGQLTDQYRSASRRVGKMCTADGAVIFELKDVENIPLPADPNMRYDPTDLVAFRQGREIWRLPYPPYAVMSLRWSPETRQLYEGVTYGIGITDVETGVRRVTIGNFTHRRNDIDQRAALPAITDDRMYVLTSDGTMLCLRRP